MLRLNEDIFDHINTIKYFRKLYIDKSRTRLGRNYLKKTIKLDLQWQKKRLTSHKNIQYQNEGWLRNNNSASVIVFIHGFLSKNKSAWLSKKGVYWPQVVHEERFEQNPDIYLFNYKSKLFDPNFTPNYVIDYLSNIVKTNSLEKRSSILLVCHSLGGIIIANWLIRHQLDLQEKKIGLLLLGVPFRGSNLANRLIMKFLLYFSKNLAIFRKISENEALHLLEQNFTTLVNSTYIYIIGKEICEEKSFIPFPFLSKLGPLVSFESSHVFFEGAYMLPNSSHFSLSKINSNNDAQFRDMIDLYNKITTYEN